MSSIDTISDADADHLLKVIADQHPDEKPVPVIHRDFLIVALLLDTGVRVGELVQLSPAHLLEPSKPGALTPFDPANALTGLNLDAAITKTKESRFLPLTDRVQFAISAHFQNWYFLRRASWPRWTFPTGRNENHITTRQVQRIVRHYGESALNLHLWPHMLRHSFATRILRTSNTRIVQQLLGHKKLTSTQIYTHPNNQDLRNAVDQMSQPQDPKT